ncbi:MAG: hypothetical protein IPJ87_10100 [Flavobacteriales bacterium]|nr:hypothetical protein [Flavobacteriales bacterium]
MRILASIAVIGAGALGVPAQTGFIVHFDSLQNGKGGMGRSVFEVPDGYMLFTIQTSHDGTGKTHLFLRQLDQQGQLLSEREYHSGDPRHNLLGYIAPVYPLDTGGFGCAVLEGSDYWAESWLYRFNGNGDTTLRKLITTYPPADSITHFILQSRQTADGGFLLAGFFDRPDQSTRAFLVRLDAQGDTLWTNVYGPVTGQTTAATGVAEYVDGGALLTGYRQIPGGPDRSFLIRTNAQGDQLWLRYYGERSSPNGAVRVLPDGHIVTWSEYRELAWPYEFQQMMLTKWDASGGIVWQKRSHYQYQSATFDMELLPDGSFITSGTWGGWAAMAKFDAQGDSLWSRDYGWFGVNATHYPYDVTPTSDGGFVMTGYARQSGQDPTPGLYTIFLIKTDSLGCVVPGCHLVGVQEYEVSLQEHLSIWPNPATDHVRLELELPPGYRPTGAVQAVLLDASGRELLREAVPGNGTVLSHLLPLTPFAPGLYHLHLADEKRWLAGGNVVVE